MNNHELWPASDLISAFDLADLSVGATGVSIDSRSVKPGELFVALSGDPGPRFGGGSDNARDGHDFIDMAVRAGAGLVMAHREVDCAVPVIPVTDTLEGLWQLGSFSRRRTAAKVAAITGSSGKTTLRTWLESVLGAMVNCHASEGSLNNHWGVPLSLARMKVESEVGLFEIGTNHPGEIAPLSCLVDPDVAVVLNVLPAHIGNFSGMDELMTEKLSISEGLSSEGTLVLPTRLASCSGYPRVLTFGEGGDVQATGLSTGSGTDLQIDVAGVGIECHVPFVGIERVDSIAAMFAVLAALGFDAREAVKHVGTLGLPKGRGNLVEAHDITVIDDSYNANPVSMKMSLAHLASMKKQKRRIALLGEMLELGEASEAAHHEMGAHLADIDEVYTFGAGFESASFPESTHFHTVAEFDLEGFATSLQAGDSILVKGSNKVFWKQGFVDELVSLISKRP